MDHKLELVLIPVSDMDRGNIWLRIRSTAARADNEPY